ncbi:STAS domain-containing protein [Amycolatopsis viridis]|uniref:STAS domain-containing protein n=1 Tax=Amycolatopsis viridis TaxID=185678 RepID=UPI0028BE60A0|nr:STAS domain-containing protein [Amycolatopsis viridis]
MVPDPRNCPGLAAEALRRDHAIVVRLAGELDLATVPRLRQALAAALAERPALLVVDLSAVEFLAAAAIGELVSARQGGRGATPIRLVATRAAIRRPLEITGVTREIPVYPTVGQALAE